MKTLKRVLAVAAMSCAMVLATVAIIIACSPSPLPPSCAQTIYLGKHSTTTHVIPGNGAPFDVFVGLLPFVGWDDQTAACAQPAASSVTLTLECRPIDNGPAFVLGPRVTNLGIPTTPGAQNVAGGGVDFPVPGGVPPSVCDVIGTYNVTFAGGINDGLLAGTGDLQVCLVEPTPADPDGLTPRLDLELLMPEPAPGEEGVLRFHAGDQEYIYIRVANNDLERDAVLRLESEGRQIAGLPDGFDDDEDAYEAGVFRISNPGEGDVFPVQLFHETTPLVRLPGAPNDPGPRPLDEDFVLPPGAVEIWGVAVNNFGACADGSCNERFFCVEGEFVLDGALPDPAKACTQVNLLVDTSLPPRFPGLTIADALKVDPAVDTQWSNLRFFDPSDDLIDETHAGNLLPGFILPQLQPGPAIQLTGDDLRGGLPPEFQFPGTWMDQITLPQPIDRLAWEAFFFYQQDGFQQRGHAVNLFNLDPALGDCAVPAITLNDPRNQNDNFVNIIADAGDGCGDDLFVQLFEEGQLVQQGTIGQLRQDQNLRIDDASCRTFSFPNGTLLDAPLFAADPPLLALPIPPDVNDPFVQTFQIIDEQGGPAAFTNVEVVGPPGLAPVTRAGNGALRVVIDPSVFEDPLDLADWQIRVHNPAFLNSPILLPVSGRKQFPPPERIQMNLTLDGPPLVALDDDEAPPFVAVVMPEDGPGVVEGTTVLVKVEARDDAGIVRLDPTSPFTLDPIDAGTPQEDLDALEDLFGEVFDGPDCLDPSLFCGTVALGPISRGPAVTELSLKPDVSAPGISIFSTHVAGDGTERADAVTPVGVLNEDEKLPVFTEEELRIAIELFNDDEVFGEKTIGLVTDRFSIEVPLPPIRGTYFFDEFESFRKDGSAQHPVLDGSRCPPPCSGLVFEADGGGVSNLRFENFPSQGIEIKCDSLWIASNEFAGNAGGGLLISGNNNFVADSLVRANRFETNGGAGIIVRGGTGNRLHFNAFTDGDGVFIDLGGDGPTPNDDGDADTGANTLQNFPVLTQVLTGGSTTIEGVLDSMPEAEYRLHFYAWSDTLLRFLGEANVRTDASGEAIIAVVVEGTAEVGQDVYATATDADGNTSEFSRPFTVVSGVAAEDDAEVPGRLALYPNYPNPFNPQTSIRYDLPEAGPVRLAVYDALGREVAVLVDGPRPAGRHRVVFDAAGLASGTYVYRLVAAGTAEARRLVLMR